MKKTKLLILALLLANCLPAQVVAGDFDGSKALICVPLETFECEPGQECDRGTAQSIDIPQFLKVDFKKKVITGTKQDGTQRTAKIEDKNRMDGALMLQGVQNGRGWSMEITEATGKMTLTASGDQIGFVVFGACIAQ
jgi:hypothetical protein